jgi:intracellular septation protein
MKDFLSAARPVLSDFLATIAFAALVALKVDVRLATGAAIAIGLAQIVILRLRGRRADLLQWASIGLVVVFGSVSLMTHDPRYLMAKPSIIYLAIAVVMLKRGWMVRYLPPIAGEHGAPLMIAWGYVWAGLMFVTAAANLAVAVLAPQAWPLFIAVFPLASKFALFTVHYVSMRLVVGRKVRAAMAAERLTAPEALAA